MCVLCRTKERAVLTTEPQLLALSSPRRRKRFLKATENPEGAAAFWSRQILRRGQSGDKRQHLNIHTQKNNNVGQLTKWIVEEPSASAFTKISLIDAVVSFLSDAAQHQSGPQGEPSEFSRNVSAVRQLSGVYKEAGFLRCGNKLSR